MSEYVLITESEFKKANDLLVSMGHDPIKPRPGVSDEEAIELGERMAKAIFTEFKRDGDVLAPEVIHGATVLNFSMLTGRAPELEATDGEN